MRSIGETLRTERERRNLNLHQVSQELKISARFLEAIEEENFDRLPAGVFAKSFARQYARLLGLDENEIGDEVQRAVAPAGAVPQFASGAPVAARPLPLGEMFVPKVDSWRQEREPGRFSWGSPLPALALVVVTMLGCSLVYGWWQRSRHPPLSASNPTTSVPTARAQQSVPPASGSPAIEPKAEPPSLVTADSGASAQADSPPGKQTADEPTQMQLGAAARASAVKVEVMAAEPVWIMARTDGKYSFSGTLAANETRTVEAAAMVLLRVGNAGGVTITLNGKPIGEVGPRGQPRTVQLTSGGFQIVAPKPLAPGDPLL